MKMSAEAWLDKAIKRHERHMKGDEPTDGTDGMMSQMLMMREMRYALQAMRTGEPVAAGTWYVEHENMKM